LEQANRLKTLLENYRERIAVFEIDEPIEISVGYLERLELEDNKDKLSKEDLAKLQEYDKRALKLYGKVKHLDTSAVDWLKDIVSIINGNIPFRV